MLIVAWVLPSTWLTANVPVSVASPPWPASGATVISSMSPVAVTFAAVAAVPAARVWTTPLSIPATVVAFMSE